MKTIAAVALCLNFLLLNQGAASITIRRESGEVFSSDFSNDSETFLRARKGQIVILTFNYFRLQDLDDSGNKTKYLELIDGSLDDANHTVTHYYEAPSVPFTFISNTHKLRLRYHTSKFTEGLGFKASFKHYDADEICNVENLLSNDVQVGYCTSFANSPISRCSVLCKKEYVQIGSKLSHCVNNSFEPVRCDLKESIVKQCEDSEMIDCPYDPTRIDDYYLTNGLSTEGLSEAELKEIESIEPINNSTFGRSTHCDRFCLRDAKTSDLTKPSSCGYIKHVDTRIYCFRCRVRGLCYAKYLGD